MISFIIASKFQSQFVSKLIELILTTGGTDNELILVNMTPIKWNNATGVSNLSVIEAGSDIGKNQAWNMGVQKASKKYICLIDDEVIFNVYALVQSISKMNPANIGLVGVHFTDFTNNKINGLKDQIELRPCTEVRKGFGAIMLMHRNEWYPMPVEMKNYYAENLLYYYFTNTKKRPISTFKNIKVMSFNDKPNQEPPKPNTDTRAFQTEIEKLSSKNINLF